MAASVILLGTNDVCLDPFQTLKIVDNSSLYKIFDPKKHPEIEICRGKRRIYIPTIVNGCHFNLIIIDLKEKTIMCYDPLAPEKIIQNLAKEAQNFVDQMQQAWADMEIKKFRVLPSYSLPAQQDNFNCGPLILYAIDLTSKNLLRSDIHSDNLKTYQSAMCEYRLYLKNLIAEKSESVLNNCLICFDSFVESDITIQCKECKRKVHMRCNEDTIIFSTLVCIFCGEYCSTN